MTSDELARLAQLAREATPGPWDAFWGEDEHANDHTCHEQVVKVDAMNELGVMTKGRVIASCIVTKGTREQLATQADMRFIAAARTYVPVLLQMLAGQRQCINELETRLWRSHGSDGVVDEFAGEKENK